MLLSSKTAKSQATQAWEAIAISEDTMGMAVVASCRGEEVSLYYGLRDYARNLPVNENTLFRIASISKLITSLAVLYLSDQGILDLHKSLTDYFGLPVVHPDYPSASITPFLLLSHRSGIQDGGTYSDFLMDTYSMENPPSILQLLIPEGSYYATNNWRHEAPGTYFVYSNLNYGLLGSIIEMVTDKRFDIFMRDDFLPLLGIQGGFNVADIYSIDDLATLYRKPGGTWVAQADNFEGIHPPNRELPDYIPGDNGLIFAPQGGLRTSASGVMQLARFLMNNGFVEGQQVIGEEHMSLLLQQQWSWDGSNGDTYFDLFFAYGAGSHITTNQPGKDTIVPNYTFIGHPGAAYGLISNIYVNLEYDASIIFITNGVGNGFRFDNRSSFFTIEKDVFEVYEHFFFNSCRESVGINPDPDIVNNFSYLTAYPNPFNPKIKISWQQKNTKRISISVYDLHGRIVANLANNVHNEGDHYVIFDGHTLASGMYLVRLSSDFSQKVVLVTLLK